MPLQTEVVIVKANVFVNPFDTLEEEAAEEAAKQAAKERDAKPEMGQWYSHPQAAPSAPVREGVGKYLRAAATGDSGDKKRPLDFGSVQQEPKRAKHASSTERDAFANW